MGKNQGLTINDISVGADPTGMAEYIETVKTIVLTNVGEALDNNEEMLTAIANIWQGASHDKFVELFKQAIEDVRTDLQAEATDLESNLNSLLAAYIAQDAALIAEDGE